MLTKLFVNTYIEASSLVFYLLIFIVNKTLRLKIIGADNYYSLKSNNRNIVFAFWHQATFIPLFHYRGRGACLLAMKSIKGQVLARTCERLGYQVTFLESEDDAAGFRKMINKAKEGYDCNLAVDGPEGPIFKLKPGAVFLAKKLRRPILPVAASASPKIVFRFRWDKYFIPWPFVQAVLILGKPVYVEGKKIEELQLELENILTGLTKQAETSL